MTDKDDDLRAQFRHDVLNHLGVAKMNAQLVLRGKDLPARFIPNLERVIANLAEIEKLFGMPTQKQSNESASSDLETQPQSSAQKTQKTILLIDDSDDLQLLFRTVFPPRGYAVLGAKNEAEALAALARTPLPDLVLLDFQLGAKTAPELLDQLERANPSALRECKIVLFTGFGDEVSDARVAAVEQKSTNLASIISLVEKHCR